MPRKPRETPNFTLRKRKDSRYWQISYTEDGKNKRFPTRAESEAEAQRELANFIAGWHAPPPPTSLSINKVCIEYLAHKKKEIAHRKQNPKLFNNIQYSITHIMEKLGHVSIASINRQIIRKYTEERQALGRSDATVRTELIFLSAALNHVRKEGWIDKAPHIDKPPPPPPRQHVANQKEIRRFLDRIDLPHLMLFSLLALHTLSRKMAVLELKWDQVDFQTGLIDFNPKGRTRTIKRRVPVPINKTLRTVLQKAWEGRDTEYVVELNGKPLLDIKKSFATAARRAGIEWLTPHVLRHTGATLMAMEGVAMTQISGIMGDDVATVTKHYLKYHPDYLREATNALDKLYG